MLIQVIGYGPPGYPPGLIPPPGLNVPPHFPPGILPPPGFVPPPGLPIPDHISKPPAQETKKPELSEEAQKGNFNVLSIFLAILTCT